MHILESPTRARLKSKEISNPIMAHPRIPHRYQEPKNIPRGSNSPQSKFRSTSSCSYEGRSISIGH